MRGLGYSGLLSAQPSQLSGPLSCVACCAVSADSSDLSNVCSLLLVWVVKGSLESASSEGHSCSRGLPGLGFRLYVKVAFGKSQGSHWPSHCVYLYQAAEPRPHD